MDIIISIQSKSKNVKNMRKMGIFMSIYLINKNPGDKSEIQPI